MYFKDQKFKTRTISERAEALINSKIKIYEQTVCKASKFVNDKSDYVLLEPVTPPPQHAGAIPYRRVMNCNKA